MHLTVAIPTLNRAKWLERCLNRLVITAGELAAAGHSLDVLVSDNHSSDTTPDVLARPWPFPLRTVRRSTTVEIYHSIATALLHGTVGDPQAAMILIGDDDELVVPGMIAALDRLAVDPGLIAVAGAMHAIHVVSGAEHTAQGCPDPSMARLRLVDLPKFFESESYVEALIARKSAWQSWHPYDGTGLPCHTRALVRFLRGGDLAWLTDVVLKKQFHKDNVSRQIYSEYQQYRMVLDRELAFSDLNIWEIIKSVPTKIGIALSRDYNNSAGMIGVSPYRGMTTLKRSYAHGWMSSDNSENESKMIIQAAVEATIALAQVSAMPGPILVPASHVFFSNIQDFLARVAALHSISVAEDAPGASGCLRLVMGRGDLALRCHDPVPQVALTDLIDMLRLTRRFIKLEGVT